MARAKLDNELIATVAGDITVYNYDGETREYLSTSVEYLAVGVGIPANSCTDAPVVAKAGFAVCRTADLTTWEYVADHRGETVYSTADRNSATVDYIGAIPDGFTTTAPATPYDEWDGEKWITDTDAQHTAAVAAADTQKTMLIATANAAIAPLQDAVDLDIARYDEQSLLLAWKKYRVQLNRIDTSAAPDIKWPTPPAEQVS